MPLRPALERLRRMPAVRYGRAVQDRFTGADGSTHAVAIAWQSFFSLFPLLLLGLAAIGFLLAGDAAAQQLWRERLTDSVPGLGALIGDNLGTVVADRAGVGLVGTLGLVWASMGIAAATSRALADVFQIERAQGFVKQKVWAVASLMVLGVLGLTSLAISAAAASLATASIGPGARAVGLVAALAMDVLTFAMAYRLLSFRRGPRLRALLPGAAGAGVAWMLLKIAGSWYAQRTVAGAAEVYGTFAGTIGVLVMLLLASRIFVYGAVIGAVAAKGGRIMEDRRNGHDHSSDGGRRTIDLVKAIANDTGTLMRKEVELARTEMVEAVVARVRAAAGAIALGVAGLIALLFCGVAAASALSLAMPAWAAWLVVAGGFVGMGGAAFLALKPRAPMPSLMPEETKRTVKEDVEWARQQLTR